jgi:DNA-binding response OmpR family regulator
LVTGEDNIDGVRLLVVEDELDLVDALVMGLTDAGFAVDAAHGLGDASEKLMVNAYDVLLLDLTLPDGDGLDLCRRIRDGGLDGASGSDVRILMVTARDGLPDTVKGFELGADDYLVKPFALAELVARIRALLRRDITLGSTVLEVGDLRLDPSRHLATRGGSHLRLTPKEFGVLEYLMTRPGHVISTEELLEHVWDEHADPFTNTVRVTVGTLRRKLAEVDGRSPIETVHGHGYRLVDEPCR